MNSVLVVYDIADNLKIVNPSPVFRRFGFRINLSCWVFPQHLVPVEEIEKLRAAGAVVHMINFAAEDQGKILDLARAELRRHAKHLVKYVSERVQKLKSKLIADSAFPDGLVPEDALYKKWRAVISRSRREALAAEHCAFGFGIDRDVADALEALVNLLSSELNLALAWKAQRQQQTQTVGA